MALSLRRGAGGGGHVVLSQKTGCSLPPPTESECIAARESQVDGMLTECRRLASALPDESPRTARQRVQALAENLAAYRREVASPAASPAPSRRTPATARTACAALRTEASPCQPVSPSVPYRTDRGSLSERRARGQMHALQAIMAEMTDEAHGPPLPAAGPPEAPALRNAELAGRIARLEALVEADMGAAPEPLRRVEDAVTRRVEDAVTRRVEDAVTRLEAAVAGRASLAPVLARLERLEALVAAPAAEGAHAAMGRVRASVAAAMQGPREGSGSAVTAVGSSAAHSFHDAQSRRSSSGGAGRAGALRIVTAAAPGLAGVYRPSPCGGWTCGADRLASTPDGRWEVRAPPTVVATAAPHHGEPPWRVKEWIAYTPDGGWGAAYVEGLDGALESLRVTGAGAASGVYTPLACEYNRHPVWRSPGGCVIYTTAGGAWAVGHGAHGEGGVCLMSAGAHGGALPWETEDWLAPDGGADSWRPAAGVAVSGSL